MNRLEQDSHMPELTLLMNVSAGRWIEDSLGTRFAYVESLVPKEYAAYARLFHPAKTDDYQSVQWSEVAEWSGKTVHHLMAFEGISVPKAGFGTEDQPWVHDPEHGYTEWNDTNELVKLLSDFTGASDRCYFAVWDGYGSFSVGGMAMLSPSGGTPILPPEGIEMVQRIKGVARDYILYTGPLSAIESFFIVRPDLPDLDGPNIWWPEDRAWCVSTDIDLDSTYIGGSDDCIEALLAHPSLEVSRTTSDAPVYMNADAINL